MKFKTDHQPIFSFISLIFAVNLIGCTDPDSNQSLTKENPVQKGVSLVFQEQSTGVDPYKLTIFVNNNYLRIQESDSAKDFILLDRKKQVIYNVNSEDQIIFEIKKKPVATKSPIAIQYSNKNITDEWTKKLIEGKQPHHFQYYAKDQSCYDVVVIEHFLESELAALREFRLILAGEHSKTLGDVPIEFLDACDLALNIFNATDHLAKGFPVREWDSKGYQRVLVETHYNSNLSDNEFVLPVGYTKFSVE